MIKRWHIFALLVLAALPCAGLAAPEVGMPAPPLKGSFFDGAPLDLAAFRGKVVLVNFYSSYCKFCAYEIGNVETFYEQNRDRGFEVIVVGVDPLEDRARVERMLGIYGLHGTMADELKENGFARRYPTPTTFLIGRDGVLREKHWGAKSPAYFREHVVPLLAEPQ